MVEIYGKILWFFVLFVFVYFKAREILGYEITERAL
jgi:hypothetical protein